MTTELLLAGASTKQGADVMGMRYRVRDFSPPLWTLYPRYHHQRGCRKTSHSLEPREVATNKDPYIHKHCDRIKKFLFFILGLFSRVKIMTLFRLYLTNNELKDAKC